LHHYEDGIPLDREVALRSDDLDVLGVDAVDVEKVRREVPFLVILVLVLGTDGTPELDPVGTVVLAVAIDTETDDLRFPVPVVPAVSNDGPRFESRDPRG